MAECATTVGRCWSRDLAKTSRRNAFLLKGCGSIHSALHWAIAMADSQTLVIGIDGGASHTRVALAETDTGAVLGRGERGTSNIQAVGVQAALGELNIAVASAFTDARISRAPGRGGGAWVGRRRSK